MQISIPKPLLPIFLALFAASAHSEQQPPPPGEYGALEYPARGNIQLDEGTVDIWVTAIFDTDFKADRTGKIGAWQATLLDLVFPDENWHYPLYFIAWANGFAFVGYTQPPQRYVSAGPPRWKPGESHRVTLTWSGRKRSVFLDGISAWVGAKGAYSSRDVIVEGELHGDLTSAVIRIGGGNSALIVDEIQIRRIALTTDEVVKAKDAPLVADANTLLLDHCDGGVPEIIGVQTGETKGNLTGVFDIVDTRFGKGIRLWREKK